MKEIIVCGYGGQGVLVTGLILADAAMESGLNVTWFPSYGAEMRGGTANCHIKINENRIASPFTDKLDILIAMNETGLQKFFGRVKSDGLVIYNTASDKNLPMINSNNRLVIVDATGIAARLDNPKGINVVMLGALAQFDNTFSAGYLLHSINRYFEKRGKIFPKNALCFRNGLEDARLLAGANG